MVRLWLRISAAFLGPRGCTIVPLQARNHLSHTSTQSHSHTRTHTRTHTHTHAGLKSHSYDIEKKPRRTNKDKRPMCDPPSDRLSTFSIRCPNTCGLRISLEHREIESCFVVCRLVLKNMCVQFLECCYNPLMKIVRVRHTHTHSTLTHTENF